MAASFCLRLDIDTIHTPWRQRTFVARVGDREAAYIPRLLDAARDRGVTLHFFALGFGAIEYPALLRRIADAGHPIDSHLHTHRVELIGDFDAIYEEYCTAEALLRSLGIAIEGVGATGMYRRGIADRRDVQDFLRQRGNRWVSSRFDVAMPLSAMQPFRYPNGLIELPCAGWSDMTFFYYRSVMPPGSIHPDFRPSAASLDWLIGHTCRLIDQAARDGLSYCVDYHPAVLAEHDPDLRFFHAVVDRAEARGVEITDLRRIAASCDAARPPR